MLSCSSFFNSSAPIKVRFSLNWIGFPSIWQLWDFNLIIISETWNWESLISACANFIIRSHIFVSSAVFSDGVRNYILVEIHLVGTHVLCSDEKFDLQFTITFTTCYSQLKQGSLFLFFVIVVVGYSESLVSRQFAHCWCFYVWQRYSGCVAGSNTLFHKSQYVLRGLSAKPEPQVVRSVAQSGKGWSFLGGSKLCVKSRSKRSLVPSKADPSVYASCKCYQVFTLQVF